MWNPDSFMERLYQSFEEKRNHLKQSENADQTKARLKLGLVNSLGIDMDNKDELRPIVLERVELADHIRERVEFGTVWGLRVPAYVLLPKQLAGKGAAVLALHGHGYGSRQIVGLLPDGTENDGPPDLHGNYALELVRRGLIVIAPEVFGFGDRRLAADQTAGQFGNSSCQSLASHLLMYGISLAGLRVQEALRALDYLISREEVDPKRIGCIGFSGGGLIGAYASAIDERVKATLLCAFTNTFKGSIMHVRHCIDNYVPGVLGYAELPDLIGLIAPRALFIESGKQDPIFPIETVYAAIEHLRKLYVEVNAESRFGVHLFEGVHEVNGSMSYPWLVGMLS
ncbi:dienelactone hydrolase family protein [Paenibacillus sedimenti]|uniref:Acetylxylan esterase n=1 Tax=Paenibacillus sedimenti TaxID=2770274 RepID=A0A926KR16_9BACL|nr:alpha/beta hydrolase family protein [Paenibacillus sedimenti]MBD0381351.1 acetylxylan esterase [Paenibacillus sedimenti]